MYLSEITKYILESAEDYIVNQMLERNPEREIVDLSGSNLFPSSVRVLNTLREKGYDFMHSTDSIIDDILQEQNVTYKKDFTNTVRIDYKFSNILELTKALKELKSNVIYEFNSDSSSIVLATIALICRPEINVFMKPATIDVFSNYLHKLMFYENDLFDIKSFRTILNNEQTLYYYHSMKFYPIKNTLFLESKIKLPFEHKPLSTIDTYKTKIYLPGSLGKVSHIREYKNIINKITLPKQTVETNGYRDLADFIEGGY